MDQQRSDHALGQNRTAVERKSDRELVVTRMFDAPPHIVFKAWSQADLFRRWWVPKSATGVSLVACDMDVRTGGKYRLEFGAGGSDTMAFYGKYLDVVPDERIVWTNDEGDEGAVTTVTFEEKGGKTLLTFHEIYPSKKALEEALAGSAAGLPEQLDQLEALLSTTTV
ncbi:MAG TPA: SRPBCC family protein [Sphingomicrobium sp.]|nr:SRPBCC family protein [Sphingomicrobium sp.]